MKNRLVVFLAGGLLFIVGLIVGFSLIPHQTNSKLAYIDNEKIFNEFVGKKELEKRIKNLRSSHNKTLDSLREKLRYTKSSSDYKTLNNKIKALTNQFNSEDIEASNLYTDQIWNQINQYVNDYRSEYGYEFIFGAQGTGNLMFVPDDKEITKEVLEYINLKYEGAL